MNAYRPDPAVVAELARLRGRRRWLVVALGGLLFLSLVLPDIRLIGQAGYGRSLLPTSFYFLHVQASDVSTAHVGGLALGLNVTYLGLGLHQLGLLLAVATFWVLYPDDINRWIYRLLVIGGWLLALSAPFLIAGRILIARAGVPVTLGAAWLPVLVSGVTIVVAARRARDRIDNTWYLAGPELM